MKPIARASLFKSALLAGVAAGSLLCGALHANAEIGVAAAVNVDARGRPPGGAPRVITLGTNVVFNEEISTDSAGLVQILLLDGTTFTVGPNSQLTIDEFVYDPGSGDARVVATLTKGVFRFVGARTSQKEGGATVKTPVGTIGIRGGVANFSCDGGECKASLVAGKSLTIVDGDGTQRIVYETGYTAVISKDAGGTTTTIRKSTKEETGLIQQQLAGKQGQSGGTNNPPTDETVANSQVGQTNSQLPDTMIVPGSTKPVQSSEPDQAEEAAGIDGKTQDDLDNDIAEEEEQPANARVLTAAAGGYVIDPANGGGTVDDPGPRGLVGSTPDSDRGVLLTATVDGRLATSDGSLDLPDYSGESGEEGDFEGDEIYPQLDRISIGNHIEDQQASYLGNPLAGYAYAGRGDFVAYLLGINGDPTQPVYVIYGTPTTPQQLAQFTDGDVKIREYTLTPDPITPVEQFGIPVVPFFRDDAYGGVNAYYDPDELGPAGPMLALSSTNLFVVEGNGGDVREYQSWIHITGEGANQKSAAFLHAGGMFEGEDGNLQMGGSRRGTFRANAYEGPVNMRGGINTIAGATGEHFFGSNADNFVIGTSVDPADSFNDVPLDYDEVFPNGGGGPFATTHVASLIGEKAITEYGQPGQPTRTTREVTGFISGMGEGFVGGSVSQKEAPYVLAGSTPNLTLNLDADTNQVQAYAEVFDVLNQNAIVESMEIRFGPHDGDNGGNAFIDDHIFGAQKNNGPENTRLRTDGGDNLAHTGSFSPGSYLVSGRANPIPGYEHCTDCDFIDWGWWGTRVETDANPGAGVDNDRQDFVHMGTWVAGDISTEAEIEDIVDGSTEIPFGATVSYSGKVIGNVALATDGGTAQYIATGDLDASYNFSSRSGGVDISNFDNGVNLTGSLGETDPLKSALVGGALTGDNVYTPAQGDLLTGSFSGAFVNNPNAAVGAPNVAAGMIGNFSFTGTDVSATGTSAATVSGITSQ